MEAKTEIPDWRLNMKHFKTVTEERQRVESVTCDCCGQPWKTGNFEINEVKIYHNEGKSYPEGCWGEALELDICPGCFKGKILPALRSLGITQEYHRYD